MGLSSWSSTCRSRPRRCGKPPFSGQTPVNGANRLPTTGHLMPTSFSQPRSRPSGRRTESLPRRTSVTFRGTFKRRSGGTSAAHDPLKSVSVRTIDLYLRRRAPHDGDRACAVPRHETLNDQLHQWRETLSASACNHRRNALTNLVKVLYGRRAAAELIDLVRFAQPPPKPRWLERSHIAAVLAQLTPRSKTVVRLQFMHWTGMRPSQMGRLQPEDFRLDEPTPFVVVPRGKGGRLGAIPLVGERLDAARDFMALRAYGSWSCRSANKALERAARKAGGRRSPCIRSAIRSRRGFIEQDRTWQTSRICTGIRTPRRR